MPIESDMGMAATPTASPHSNITISSPEHIDEHLGAIAQRLDRANLKKTMGFKQLDDLRKMIMQDFIQALAQQGIDVSSPNKMQEFLMELEQTNPDLAEVLLWAFGQLMPSAAQQDHMRGLANPDIQVMGAPPGETPPAPMGAPSDQETPQEDQLPEEVPEEAPAAPVQ